MERRFYQLCVAVLTTAMLCVADAAQNAAASVTYYISPAALGAGDGSSTANAAAYTNQAFWSGVQATLASDPVTVRWLDGEYNNAGLTLTDMGDPYHQLTLTGDTPSGAILNAPVSTMLQFKGVQNTLVKHLTFTDPAEPDPDPTDTVPGYGFQITSNGSTPSRKIVMDSLTFTDMTQIYYGATGTTHDTYDVSLRNSTFNNVGSGGHAHMMYNAYDPHHISVYNNMFTDSKGDYIRFRDDTEYGSVISNVFLSTSSTYNRPMIAVPLFNGDNPNADPPPTNPNYEHFGTHFVFQGNQFTYNSTSGSSNLRDVIAFYHNGYDPPGYNYLLTPEQGEIIENGTTEEKKELLLSMGIDGDKIHVYNNSYTNAHFRGSFHSSAAYGAVSKGWSGYGDIYDTWNLSIPNVMPGDKLVGWGFDSSDNGGTGWTDNSYQALEDAGWRIQTGAADDSKTFVDTDGSAGGANGLMWIRDWVDGNPIGADYSFDWLPVGKAEWTMGIAGAGSQFGLYNGGVYEGGLGLLGVQLVDSDTIRIANEPVATRDKTFAGVDFAEPHNWSWEWASDPDGVNGTASLMFQNHDGSWEVVYSTREFDYNVVPDTIWFESPGDLAQGNYIVLDSFSITALQSLNGLEGDFNQDGILDALDWMIFLQNNARVLDGLGPVESYLLGDLDRDGDNDTDDFMLFRNLYNVTYGPGSFSAMVRAVPEPGALGLALIGLAALLPRFRGRQRVRVKWLELVST